MYYNVLFVRSEFNLTPEIWEKYKFYCVSPHTANSIDEALRKLAQYEFDCIIIEVSTSYHMEDDPLTLLREATHAPILALVHGKEYPLRHHCLLVADDCVFEPFETDEIIARGAALVERGHTVERRELQDRPVHIHEMIIIPKFKKVRICDHPVELTATEYRILLLLARNCERIISQAQICDNTWGDKESYESEKAVSYHIGNIRKKLAEFSQAQYIETVRCLGYRLTDPSINVQLSVL